MGLGRVFSKGGLVRGLGFSILGLIGFRVLGFVGFRALGFLGFKALGFRGALNPLTLNRGVMERVFELFMKVFVRRITLWVLFYMFACFGLSFSCSKFGACLMVQRFPQVRPDYILIPITTKPLARSRQIRVVSFCRQIQVERQLLP